MRTACYAYALTDAPRRGTDSSLARLVESLIQWLAAFPAAGKHTARLPKRRRHRPNTSTVSRNPFLYCDCVQTSTRGQRGLVHLPPTCAPPSTCPLSLDPPLLLLAMVAFPPASRAERLRKRQQAERRGTQIARGHTGSWFLLFKASNSKCKHGSN